MIRIKRTYDPPARTDGTRLLVERLWPRGMKKEALDMDAWVKDVAPSTELRRWFGHQSERWSEFQKRYRKELRSNPDVWSPILEASSKGDVTLLYSAHDETQNSALVLRDFLVAKVRRRARSRASQVTHARTRKRASDSTHHHQESS